MLNKARVIDIGSITRELRLIRKLLAEYIATIECIWADELGDLEPSTLRAIAARKERKTITGKDRIPRGGNPDGPTGGF